MNGSNYCREHGPSRGALAESMPCSVGPCDSPRTSGSLYCAKHGPTQSAASRTPLVRNTASIICPHCQTRGRVSTRSVNQKGGVSGGKAIGAILTAGVSLFATGLSRKERVTEMHCGIAGRRGASDSSPAQRKIIMTTSVLMRAARRALAPVTLLLLVAWTASAAHARQASTAKRPNIVFVLTDDLTWNLIPYMPHVQSLEHQGMTFTNYTVTDSLCCPSRTSIFTGEYPHNDGVTRNTYPGGWRGFLSHHDGAKSFAIPLHQAGYATSFAGKYLNSYAPRKAPNAPRGWTDWHASDENSYDGWDYSEADNGTVHHYGEKPRDYTTWNFRGKAQRFINAQTGPFFAEVADYAPHRPYAPARVDANAYPDVTAPHDGAWNQPVQNAPAWLANVPAIDPDESAREDGVFRERVRSVMAVDQAVGDLEATLKANHKWSNTYFLFSSDNGMHIGEYRLHPGKQTAFDTDIEVPLIVTGPGVPAGSTNDDLVSNIDLAPTFERLAGTRIKQATVDGHSIVPLLHGQTVPWRSFIGVEHTAAPTAATAGPDVQSAASGLPPDYTAIRTTQFTYIEDATSEREYYDRTGGDLDRNRDPIAADPYELNNIYAELPATRQRALHTRLHKLSTCVGYQQCWRRSVVRSAQ
jgi:N-acetylglucosamine-6-sulfatase